VTTDALKLHSDFQLSHWLELTKFRISVVSTLTAAMGYVAAAGRHITFGLANAVAGTLLLAMAASALNEVQEAEIDARMKRTRGRPLPSGSVPRSTALVLVCIMTALGAGVLYAARGATPALLGLLALVWYNGIYTPLKRITAFAVVPGSVIGALPPAIGWTAAGGALDDPAVLSLCFLFFMWQVPHFWILSLRHQRDYAGAGLPTIGEVFSPTQVHRLIFTWTCASVAASMLMLVFRAVVGVVGGAIIILAGAWLVGKFAWMLRATSDHVRLRASFMDINRYALAIMAAVIFDGLVGF
jgi:protoheme IX farnesyltransferase